jgi:hypothetical protein
MKIRMAMAAAAMAISAIGSASPASAELLDGTYGMVGPGGLPMEMVVTSCGAECKRASINGGNPRDYHLEGSAWRCVYGDGDVSTVDSNSLVFQDGNAGSVFVTTQLVKVN